MPNSSTASIEHSSCTVCPINCSFCEKNTGDCILCAPGFYLLNTSCFQCSENCVLCPELQTCTRCALGFELENGNCKPIQTTKNPEDDTALPQVSALEVDLVPEKVESTEVENSLLPRCFYQFKDSFGKCYICQNQYYLNSELKCKLCSQNCAKCLSDRFCLLCKHGFKLEYDSLSNDLRCFEKKVGNLIF